MAKNCLTKNLSWKIIKSLPFGFNRPFVLKLKDDDQLAVTDVIRILPGKRVVVFGTWQNRPVVAKLFFDEKHCKNEVNGLQNLAEKKIPAPQLFHVSQSADKGIYAVIMERITNAESLADIWQSKRHFDDVLAMIKPVLIELATQHVLGVRQRDLHLNNFLIKQEFSSAYESRLTIFTLDGAAIDFSQRVIPKLESMENLALFVSQLGALDQSVQKLLFNYYAKARGWLLKQNDFPEFLLMIKKHHDKRWQDFQKKIYRDSTEFKVIKSISSFGLYQRNHADAELIDYLQHPESFFKHKSAQLLKNGRSSTVIKVTIGTRELVVKRYNIKNIFHRLRRALRRTRAYEAWRIAHKLNLFHVATAKPIAFIETRLLGLHGKSYYISEYINGTHGSDYFEKDTNYVPMIAQMMQLLKQIFNLEMTHGDLKITNILINKNEQPFIIDLDGAKEHESMSSLRRTWRKEMKRFLKNFKDQPILKSQFISEMKRTF